MTVRSEILLNAAADWAMEQRQLYDARFSNPELISLTETAKNKADKAYRAAAKVEAWNDADDRLGDFFEAAIDYFRLNLHLRAPALQNTLQEPENFKAGWTQLKDRILSCANKASIIKLLSNSPLILNKQWVFALTKQQGHYDNGKFREEAIARLEAHAEENFEIRYGDATVYERIGREFAVDHFAQLTGQKIKWANRGKNLNIYRMHHIERILKSANEHLLKNGEVKGNAKELVEILLNRDFSSLSTQKSQQLKWAITEGFQAQNIDVRAFLNSISKARNQLKAEGISFD